MTENLFEAQYDLTKKSKIKKFYETNKILIFSSVSILVILLGFLTFYLEKQERKKILLSENYIQAKIYIESNNRNEALNTLKKVIFANDPTYSTLSLFFIVNQNLISEPKEISALYDHLLENIKFKKELRNLLIYKKAMVNSNLVSEAELLEIIKPLVSTENLWKPHALLLMGDFFMSKGEKIKAAEFYKKILSINNLHGSLYDQAKFKLVNINHE